MSRLPEKFELQTLRALELQLHRGQAAAPAGTMDGMSWLGRGSIVSCRSEIPVLFWHWRN